MPIFEYRCKTCESIQEVFHTTQKAARDWEEGHLCRCENCRGGDLERIPSSFSAKFIGSGFYVNDYKGDNK